MAASSDSYSDDGATPQLDLTGITDRTPRGIAGAVSRAIRDRDFPAGARLPTVRDVAAELGVSPATVSSAWQALRRAGLVESRGRAGSFAVEPQTPWLSPRQRGLVGAAPDELRLDLSRGIPDPALLPDLEPALHRVSQRAGILAYQDEPVLPDLRAALLADWPYDPAAITVLDGATDGIARILEQVVTYGDRVVLESPGFPPLFDLVETVGGEVVPVSLDEHGVRPDSLRRALDRAPVAVVLQPRAHNPTGISTSVERCADLAEVLRRHPGDVPWLIEDDHSGSICTAPDVTLAEHLPDRVVHVRSYSKSHGPDLRIAALAGPSEMVDRIVARRMLGPAWTSRMLQTILLDLISQARSMDAVAEARRQYFARQHTMADALATHGVEVAAPDGINLWLPVRNESAAMLQLAAAGIRVAPGTPFLAPGDRLDSDRIRVTSGSVDPAHTHEVAAALAAATTA